ncbi:outer membrane protein transport protein [candidate division KSB1 bacterium]|nr:outer membrane protein transport protein [candidate division KSB1 bacterium]
MIRDQFIRPRILIAMILFGGIFQIGFGQSELPVLGRSWGAGARAMAMGGAFSSVADDYTATYWNPAGLALIRRMEFLCSLPHLQYQNEAAFDQNVSTRQENFTKLNSLGFAFPVPTYRGSLVFAFGYNRVQNFDNAFAFSWFNPTESNPPDLNDKMTESWDRLEKGHLGQYLVSAAVDLSPNLSAGVSLNFWRGKDEVQSSYLAKEDKSIEDWTLDRYGWDDVINSELSAVNFKLGGLYRVGRFMRFAGALELPATIKIEENSNSHYQEIWETGPPVDTKENFSFDYKIATPFKFSVGASVYLPLIVVSGDIQYADWTQMEYKTDPPFTKLNPILVDSQWVYLDSTKTEINRDIRNKYRATTQIHLGTELTLPFLDTQLRAGAFLEPSPFKDKKLGADKKYFTLGAGILLDKQMKLDIAYIHGWWENKIPGFTSDIPTLEQKVKLNQFEVSLAIRF